MAAYAAPFRLQGAWPPPSGAYDWVEIGCALIAEESEQELAGAAAMVSRIGRAIAAMHGEPGRDWLLQALAALAPMARAAFAERFTVFRWVRHPCLAQRLAARLRRVVVAGYIHRGAHSIERGLWLGVRLQPGFKVRHGCAPMEYGRDGKGTGWLRTPAGPGPLQVRPAA